jgi:hypothetical protein
MSWTIDWGVVARRDLLELPRSVAERLDAAVIRFAQTDRGPVTRLYSHDPRRLQLVVTGAIAYMHADERSGVLHIGRVFRRAR